MPSAAAALVDFDGVGDRAVLREHCRRTVQAVGRHAVIGLAAVATVGLLVVGVTMVAAWIVNAAVATSPHIHAKAHAGPGRLALVKSAPGETAVASFEPQWRRATPGAKALVVDVPQAEMKRTVAGVVPPPKPRAARATSVPLPRPFPGERQVARLPDQLVVPQPEPQAVPQPVPKAAPQIAVVTPPPPATVAEKPVTTKQAPKAATLLPDPDSRTAVYDISARAVYMPNGKKLEAHSGFGERMDNPRQAHVKMRGPTPPNVYELTLRERLFHGVQAIRLNPVDEAKMFGRDGMLAHSYLLGPNGQSHGCVSFKHYQAFLDAYMSGEIDRLVVVADRSDTSWRTVLAQLGPPKRASREVARLEPVRRYAARREPIDDVRPVTW